LFVITGWKSKDIMQQESGKLLPILFT